MKEIRAFVGHSFNTEDEEVVRKFLDYFRQVADSHSNFSWENALQAEPRVLAEKVMALLEGKNTFIGICTRKERVLQEGTLVRPKLFGGFPKINEQHLVWKPSDWVIQEIGLAIGKGLELMLLIETGVREPGGLQGDMEYIPFDRNSPEKSFGKILEMITALSPKPSGSAAVSPDPRGTTTEEVKSVANSEGLDTMNPKPDWKRRDYEFAFFQNVYFGNASASDAIDRAYLATESAAQDDNKVTWQAFREYTQISFGKSGSLAKPKSLASANPASSKTLELLAKAYEHYQEFSEAARTYEAAAHENGEKSERIRLLCSVSVAQANAGERDIAFATIDRIRTLSDGDERNELLILSVLRQLAELIKADQDYLVVMERLAEINPGDTDTLFSLAYKYAETGSDDLALLHYLRIPETERNGVTWNNLGVSFDNRSLPSKSVNAYRKAEEKGETLAMSNLAYKLMRTGFLREAQQECDTALKVHEYHKNIGLAISELRGLQDAETSKLDEMLKKAKPTSDYYRQLGRASTLPEPESLSNIWDGPDCPLKTELSGNSFTAVGSYEQPPNALATALSGFGIPNGSSTPTRLSVEYRGKLRGRTIAGQIMRSRDGTPMVNTLLTTAGSESKFLMVLTDDDSELRVMETQGNSHRFYSLNRKGNNFQSLAST